MKLYVIGSSLTSCYWNGAATYYRGIYKHLHALGHDITFAQPDIYKRQQNRDGGTIDYAKVRVYQTPRDLKSVLAEASASDLVIKHSGIGADDELVQGNFIGTDVTGSNPLGNGTGVLIDGGSSNNTIGGTTAGAGNTIAYSAGIGVDVDATAGAGNTIRWNAMFGDAGPGIVLANPSNDVNDPVFTAVTSSGGTTEFSGANRTRVARRGSGGCVLAW